MTEMFKGKEERRKSIYKIKENQLHMKYYYVPCFEAPLQPILIVTS